MPTKGKQVLIIEDDPDLLEALEEEFTQAGFEVFGARDGVVGLELRRQHKPPVMLLDLLLPQMRGLEILEKLRQEEGIKRMKVVVLTNFDDPEFIEKAKDLGVDEYLLKANHSLKEIVESVEALLAQGEPRFSGRGGS